MASINPVLNHLAEAYQERGIHNDQVFNPHSVGYFSKSLAQLTIDHKRKRYHKTVTATGVNSRLSQVEVQALVTFRDDLRNVLPVDD